MSIIAYVCTVVLFLQLFSHCPSVVAGELAVAVSLQLWLPNNSRHRGQRSVKIRTARTADRHQHCSLQQHSLVLPYTHEQCILDGPIGVYGVLEVLQHNDYISGTYPLQRAPIFLPKMPYSSDREQSMASHTLRQRAEVDNIRYAYESKSGKLSSYHSASSSSGSERSYRQQRSDSDRSYQTQPTEYSGSSDKRPSIRSYDTCEGRVERSPDRFFPEKEQQASPRTSSDTYASTVVSEDEEEIPEDIPEYALPEYIARPYDSGVLPATPSDFSDLFPSHRKLTLRHDDSTLDGNMNLRVDTDVLIGGRKRDMTLFHLRMHDLKNREFSLRRYCRDSGREVCHSVQKHQKPIAEKRPGFQRSLSNALNSIRPRSEARTPTLASLKRNDSGYGSMHSVDFDQKERPRSAGNATEQATNHTVKLEFSNYAQVEIKRTGTKANKRYDFEYWGVDYSWKHVARKDNHTKQVSFALFRSGSEQPLAFIVPVPLSRSQAHNERKKGGWIPPCTMWISDSKIVNSQKDVSE